MKLSKVRRGWLVMALAVGLVPAAGAADFGTITGLIKDGAKAPVAGATITAVRQDGNAVRSTISNSEGVYSFPDVVPGIWSITAQADGNADFTVPSLSVAAGR